ncbi:MAG: DUF2314 domain-containing protein [Deltaproteobacteria bacterium]|nr:MAG: DUF2314 domain-containing protein [Deltaproteobacteria bacterium]
MSEAQIIVCVPGPWEGPQDLIKASIEAGRGAMPEYLIAGPAMMHVPTRKAFRVDMQGPHPSMREAFEYAGQGRLSPETLAAIDDHQSAIYLLAPAGPDEARALLGFVTHLLDAGGYAVKIESAGVAHEADKWRAHAALGTTLAAYDLLVTLVGGRKACFSCGMHHFGLPDAAAPSTLRPERLPEILTALNQRQLLGQAASAGELFATDLHDTVHELIHQPFGYPEDSPMNNPHGRWFMAPTPQPLGIDEPEDGPLMMAIASDDPEVREAVAQARATWPRFIAFVQGRFGFGRPIVKVRLANGEHSGFFWLLAERVDGEAVVAQVFEMPPELGIAAGSHLSVGPDEVQDWAIIRHGALIGGFTMRLQHARVSDDKRRFLELYTGVLCEEPLAELGL